MIITDFERNVVQLNGNAKKKKKKKKQQQQQQKKNKQKQTTKHESLTGNTIELKKILKIKIH